MRKIDFYPLLLIPLFFTACATVNKEKIAKVQRVAIIGFDVTQQRSVDATDLTSLVLGKAGAPTTEMKMATVSKHVDPMIRTLEQQLETQKKWTVLSQSDLKKSPTYQTVFKKSTKGFSNRPSVNERYDIFRSEYSVDFFAAMTISSDDLKKIAQELHVDTLVFASSKVDLNNSSMLSSLVGKGEFKPSSNFTIILADGSTGEKIYTKSFEGPKIEAGLKNTIGMTDIDQLYALAQVATKEASEKLVQEIP